MGEECEKWNVKSGVCNVKSELSNVTSGMQNIHFQRLVKYLLGLLHGNVWTGRRFSTASPGEGFSIEGPGEGFSIAGPEEEYSIAGCGEELSISSTGVGSSMGDWSWFRMSISMASTSGPNTIPWWLISRFCIHSLDSKNNKK